MILFKKQRETVGNFLIRKNTKKDHRIVQLKKIRDWKKVGIFFDASSNQCRKTIKEFIRKIQSEGKQVQAVGYIETKKPEENLISDKTIYYSSLLDFSFFFLPKKEEIVSFISDKPDVLLVLTTNNSFPASAIVKLSKAGLKVGFSGIFDNDLDITFELSNPTPDMLIEQIEHYLGQ
ncbi:DUF6913 domain-containing protein [Thermophagus sp. OGC60D27]|uniref:DUF6913 domain-containing protein n=1 Tax=Thermophagus sp. OGC60D27 TaxID=3458415 RepID=UPI004037EED5